MHKTEKFVRHYNRLNGKPISKKKLAQFHHDLKKEIDSKRIDSHCPLGVECIDIEQRLSKALKRMNGSYEYVERLTLKPIAIKGNLIVTQTAQGPEIIKGKKKVFHYHHEDITYLYGLENIENDSSVREGKLDGLSDTTYKVITDRILELIQGGELIWRKPWNEKVNGHSDLAHNYVTKNMYRGGNYYLNYLRFGMEVLINGKKKFIKYNSPYFFTFKQITELGGKVKTGENAWPVVYFKWLYKDLKANKLVDKKEAVEGGKLKAGYQKFPGLFYYNVFNYEQCDGLKVKAIDSKKRTVKEKIDSAEQIVKRMPNPPEIKISHSDRAFYSPSKDFIQMPLMNQFKIDQQYYSVLFHEMIHSTGSHSRLDRDLTGKFGSKSYAFEELIAELGASYLCGESGILYFTMNNSAAYIQNWSTALKKEMRDDPKFFLHASGKAQKAADYILNRKDDDQPVKVIEQSRSHTRSAIKRPEKAKVKSLAGTKRKVKKVMHEFKEGKLKSSSGKKVTKPDQAVAIAMSEAGISKKKLGFVSADQAPEKPKNLIRLKGPIGDLLQDLQPYKLVIVVAGETHSSKSQLGMQIADAFAEAGYQVGILDWEQGGLPSADTQRSLTANVKPDNKKRIHISAEVPKTLESVKALSKQFDVVVLDSGTKLNLLTNAWIDELRDEYPNTIWVPLMQQNSQGGTRGGSAAEFDTPVMIKTYRPDFGDYKKNYAWLIKNRGNKTDLYYNIYEKKLIDKPKNHTP